MLLDAPVGVATIAVLEERERTGQSSMREALDRADPRAVDRAVAAVKSMTFGDFLAVVLDAAHDVAGPWTPNAPEDLAQAYRSHRTRRPIAEAITARFATQLRAPLDYYRQEWWWHDNVADDFRHPRPVSANYEQVYGNGEFTWAGVWTVTSPPPEIHRRLESAWDFAELASRWSVPIRPDGRVYPIDGPNDWVALVERFPHVAEREHDGWELPGVNSRRYPDEAGLEAASEGRARRSSLTRHVLPEWRAVATHYDGVHLSWAGFLTCEGYIAELPSGGVTMLRYWGSERTHWLTDVLGEPVKLPESVRS